MKKLKYIILMFIISVTTLSYINIANAAINLAITPIKYELEGWTWTTITKTAKIRNPSTETVHIITGKSDFVPNWENGVPKFIRKSEMVYPDQQLSEWITISTNEFDLAPGETKVIDFDINIPDNATPGWHYWAIFFKNNNSESSSWASVWINVDYWILILLNVKWEIIIDADIQEPIIYTSWWWGGGGGWNQLIKDYCPNWDNSESYYDWTCEWNTQENTSSGETNDETTNTEEDNNQNTEEWNEDENQNNEESNNEEEKKDFKVWFIIPIDNKWNTHIKPKWKIVLKDEDWNIIKNVWKEIVVNDKWAIVWERIVDYIPINDVGWVVIPGSSRKFECDWKGFPYRDYDDEWNPVIKYWNPDEYYTKQNLWESKILMPWEQIKERKVHKKITADFDLKYKGLDWEDIEYNSAKEFPVEYTEKYVAINYYVLYPILAFLVFIFILILLILRKRTKCSKCWKSIKKDMKVCPYCGTKQKKKK